MKTPDDRCVCRSSARCAYCMMRDGTLDVKKAENGVVAWFKRLAMKLHR